jgi:hypothetical protein
MIPLGMLMSLSWVFFSLETLVLIISLTFGLLVFSIRNPLHCYQQVRRKKRRRISSLNWNGLIQAVFQKETTTVWRDNLLFSVFISSVVMGIFCGYFASFGSAQFLPDSLRVFTANIPVIGYGFMGIYVLVVYTAVFMGLNMFLNEDKTIWLIHHLPITTSTVIWGKIASLMLSLIACIPFLAFFAAFTDGSEFWMTLWLLLFGFLAGCMLSITLGSYYCGRKSDVLLLYSVSLIMFVVLGIGLRFGMVFESQSVFYPLMMSLVLVIETVLLAGSVSLSSRFLSLSWQASKIKNIY